MSTKVNRRGFIKGTAAGVGAAALAGGGVTVAPALAQASLDPRRYPFENPPPPIPRAEITGTQTFDVVVAGAGIAGLTAALSAAEAGASVALIEKAPAFSARGGDVTALNSRLHEQLGIRVDPERIIRDLMKVQGGRIHHHVVRLWADNSARVMNWAMDMVEGEGLETFLVMPTEPTLIIDRWPNPGGTARNTPTSTPPAIAWATARPTSASGWPSSRRRRRPAASGSSTRHRPRA